MKSLVLIVILTLSSLTALKSQAQVHLPQGWNIVALTVGDRTCDGHCKTEKSYYFSNLTNKQISLAYAEAAKKIGFDFSEEVAVEYENAVLPSKITKALKANGIAYHIEGNSGDLEEKTVSTEEFFMIYIGLVKLAAPQARFIPIQATETFIGGYGLFE